MQLKTINEHGQCRGRPPVRGSTAVGQLDSWQSGTWNTEHGTRNTEHGTRNPIPISFHKYRPRDWINRTCSVNLNIPQNRRKYRLKTLRTPAEKSGEGEVRLGLKIEG